MRTNRLIVAAALAAVVLAGCGAKVPGSGPGDDAPASVTPAQQCQLVTVLARGAETGLLLAKIKSPTGRAALFATLDGVKAGAADYCAAVETGNQDAFASFLLTFNAALDSFNAQLRAAQVAELSAARTSAARSAGKAPATLALGRGPEALACTGPGAGAGLAGGSSGA